MSDLVDGSITLPDWFHSFYPQTRVSDILGPDPCLILHGKRVIHTTFRTSIETGNSLRFSRGSAHSTHVEPVSNHGCESDKYNGLLARTNFAKKTVYALRATRYWVPNTISPSSAANIWMYRLTFTLSPALVFLICPQPRPDLLPVNDVYRAVQLDP